jgi:hypothetical protein
MRKAQIVTAFESLRDATISDFKTDAVNLVGNSASMYDCDLTDTVGGEEPHRDFAQIRGVGLEPNAQFFGAISDFNDIIGNKMFADSQCQGIGCFDGGVRGLLVANNTINTNSFHKITIGGALSARFDNNRDNDNNLVPVTLEPMRIGGGHPKRFWVLSFKDDEYLPIEGDSASVITDNRAVANRPHDNYLHDFDLKLFRRVSEDTKYDHDGFAAHFEMVLSMFDIATLTYNSSAMRVENGYLHIPDYRKMSSADMAWFKARWKDFIPKEVASNNFDVIFSVHALDMLQLIRIDLDRGISPTNMYRNARHNVQVGSRNPFSDHTYHTERSSVERDGTFAGIDIPVFSREDAMRVEELAIKYGFNAIGRYPNRHFIHIGMRNRKASGALYRWGRRW